MVNWSIRVYTVKQGIYSTTLLKTIAVTLSHLSCPAPPSIRILLLQMRLFCFSCCFMWFMNPSSTWIRITAYTGSGYVIYDVPNSCCCVCGCEDLDLFPQIVSATGVVCLQCLIEIGRDEEACSGCLNEFTSACRFSQIHVLEIHFLETRSETGW